MAEQTIEIIRPSTTDAITTFAPVNTLTDALAGCGLVIRQTYSAYRHNIMQSPCKWKQEAQALAQALGVLTQE